MEARKLVPSPLSQLVRILVIKNTRTNSSHTPVTSECFEYLSVLQELLGDLWHQVALYVTGKLIA